MSTRKKVNGWGQRRQVTWNEAETSMCLQVPQNIILFQPPHCPQLNPIEQVWQYLKRRWCWTLPKNLKQLRQLLKEKLEELTPDIAASTCRQSILDALSATDI